eukprot:GHVR01131742.1.p2 GENE.GHVR01131742.1~~GHVR01131742.1.p2  ORF type:complete len:122 (-),score=13.15 GHVR01131742.1:1241-1606(-)
MGEAMITYFGQKARVKCDGVCNKAWGMNNRPKILLSQEDDDDYAWLSDDELGEAPVDPGTYEGGVGKPLSADAFPTKWCVRECERCVMSHPGEYANPLVLRDFSKRVYNYPQKSVAETVKE